MNYFWAFFFGTSMIFLIIKLRELYYYYKKNNSIAPSVSTPILESKILRKGLQVDKLKEGSGPTAVLGKHVTVHYRAFLNDGKEVDSSYEKGMPFQFTLGQRQVIPGWEMGMIGMKMGEVRRFIISSEHAYGTKGKGKVPPNAEIIFEVTLLKLI